MYRIYRDRKQGEGAKHFADYSIREAVAIEKQPNGVQLYDKDGTETYFIPWDRVDEILNLEAVDDKHGDDITRTTDSDIPDFTDNSS